MKKLLKDKIVIITITYLFLFLPSINSQILVTPGGSVGSSINSNVGIGTNNNPTEKLDVNGNILLRNFSNVSNAGAYIHFSSYSDGHPGPKIRSSLSYASGSISKSKLILSSYWEGYKDELTLMNGNVGIGTNNPATKLDVAGSIQTRPITVGNGTNIIIGDDFINDGSIRRWVIDRRNDNYFGQENKGLVIWADKSNGYFAPLLLKEDGNLILVGANNAINKNVGIGILNPSYKLDVNGTIHAREVKVDLTGWSDFVFHPSYQLKPLTEVEQFIKANGHLHEFPSAAEVEQNGVNVGEMQKKLLQKVEELTLYVIEQQKQLNEQQKLIEKQNQRINQLEQNK